MIPGHCVLRGDGQRQHEGARAAAQARRTSCEDPQIQQGPVQKGLLQLGQEGRLRTDAEPGLPRGRSLVAGFPALGTILWRDQEQVDALGWISLGRNGTGGGLEDGNLLPAGLLSLHHHTWGTK